MMEWDFSLVSVLGLLLWCVSIQNYCSLCREDREFIRTWLIVYLAIIIPISFPVFNFLLLKEMLCRVFSLLYWALLCDTIWAMKALFKFKLIVILLGSCCPKTRFRFIAIILSKVTFFVCRPFHDDWRCLHLTKIGRKLKAWLWRSGHLRCTHINEVIELQRGPLEHLILSGWCLDKALICTTGRGSR